MLSFIECTDFYKTDRRQMEPGTTRILENFTARAGRIPGVTRVVFIGLDVHLKYDLTDLANATFFSRPKADVIYEYQSLMDSSFGPNGVGTEHIAALHDLQYLPLEYCALPEGTLVPYKIPMFTVENTHDEFAWVPGYLETLTSSRVWQSCTSATLANRFRKMLSSYAGMTGGDLDFVQWQGHDFSFRGMGSPEAAAMSGIGHLASFKGTDTIPALRIIRDVYGGKGMIGGSVPATEHMVMCLGGQETEIETFRRLLKLYPTGTVSIVSDTWDLWHVLTKILPQLKKEIMARDGKVVIRPDSGDPVKILTGDMEADSRHPAHKGVVECQWDIFSGTRNLLGFKSVDPHIGSIYGDSITYERGNQICERLADKGFVTTSSVFGIGSFSYQYVTRDTHGFAIKATWAKVKGEERVLFKDPVTDDGTKRSARGRLVVVNNYGAPALVDGLTYDQQKRYVFNQLQPVWRDGRFLKRNLWSDICSRLA
jgi:nicotinamide phosphoribosyltransferase